MPYLPQSAPSRATHKSLAVRFPKTVACVEVLVALFYLAVMGYGGGDAGFFNALPSLVKAGVLCVAALILLLRRRFPIAALLALAALSGVVPMAGLLTAMAAYAAARRIDTPRKRGVVLLGAAVLPMVTGIVGTVGSHYGTWVFGFAMGAVVGAVGVLIPGLVGSSAGQQERLVLALRDRAAAAEEARQLADNASRVEERSRIAAEMHDLVGHRLSLISLHTGGLEMALASQAPELKEEAAQVRLATRDAMNELREVLGVLGPLGRNTGTDALTDATGTRSDIEALAEESRAAGIPVTLTWDGADLDTLEPRVRRAVHRVVRESLTNVHRYATGAAVELTVAHTEDLVRVRIRNGVPPVPPEATTGLGTGRGLNGLRERVRLLGGELRAEPTRTGGFLVEASVPARPAPSAAPAAESGPVRADDLVAEATRRSGALPAPLRTLSGAATGLLGLAGVGAMLLFGLAVVQSSRPIAGSVNEEATVRVGMSREQVSRLTSFESDLARAAAAGKEPPRPPGTQCYFPYTSDRGRDGRIELTRYCFRNNVLLDIANFSVPLHEEVG